ncbi:hypothetical protein [Sodaliphilus pleomorphus]|uniref:Uncharacterized protein n=1 Tax=Sodaliphilus pleomorphus TaxID=2606626 RepID=A0A6L5XAI9_9BACT|nr:hypothetical protein [Sodaliphilus pleomorphus]MSS17439.1 hypothetical protein [Sodaliphilus pleomorphus]
MDILQKNPYRLLGVYANSPTKERMANHNKLKAFLKVGKQVSYPLDLPQYLTSIDRDEATIAEAESKLTLPKDQLHYALFWFVNVTTLDSVAFKHLVAGKIEEAKAIWMKKTCASSLQNLTVCALIQNDFSTALSQAEQLYGNSNYLNELVTEITGGGENVDATALAFDFLDTLATEVDTSTLLTSITNSSWRAHIAEKAVKPLVEAIQNAIDVAKKSRNKGPQARLKAGLSLKEATRDPLLQLQKMLPAGDLQYQLIADKLGKEILQCGIDYYNDSEEPDAAIKAMELQKYALSIVVGQMAKDRCKENVDILQKIIDNLPPAEVFAEDKAIHEELRKYCKLPDKICHAVTLLKNTRPHLQSIKRKLGSYNDYYLHISTVVVRNAMSNLIAEVNGVQKQITDDPLFDNLLERREAKLFLIQLKLKEVLKEAWDATKLIDEFDMEDDYRKEHYNPNRSTLKSMCEDLGISTFSMPFSNASKLTPTTDSDSGSSKKSNSYVGWLIAIFVIIILAMVFISAFAGMPNGDSATEEETSPVTEEVSAAEFSSAAPEAPEYSESYSEAPAYDNDNDDDASADASVSESSAEPSESYIYYYDTSDDPDEEASDASEYNTY